MRGRLCLVSIIVCLVTALMLGFGLPASAYNSVAGSAGDLEDVNLQTVDAADAEHVWAGGEDGMVLFYNGSEWQRQEAETNNHIFDMSATGPESVYATQVAEPSSHTGAGPLLHYDGSDWSTMELGPGIYPYAVTALDDDHIWATTDGDIYFFDGSDWTKQHTVENSIMDIEATGTDSVYAVGNDFHRFDGTDWTTEEALVPIYEDDTWEANLRGISIGDDGSIWALGDFLTSSSLLIYDDGLWEPRCSYSHTTGISEPYAQAIEALDSTHAWVAVNDSCYKSMYAAVDFTDGSQVNRQYEHNTYLLPKYLTAICAVDAEHAWVVGNGGLVLEYDGASWFAASGSEPEHTQYLAEGCTAHGFETYLLVANPEDEEATVNVMYMTSAGLLVKNPFTMPGKSRYTIRVNDDVPDRDVSAKVVSDRDIVCERAMYWGDRVGGHDSIAAGSLSNTWYLAEGCSANGFETWILVQNPGESKALVQLTYMTTAGEIEGPSLTLAPRTRHSVNIADTVASTDVSTRVVSDQPVVVERSVYWNERTGGHCSLGYIWPPQIQANVWQFAEGCTANGFETWVMVQNPQGTEAEVEITYMTPEGRIDGPRLTLAPNTRHSVNVSDTVVTTDVSIMASSAQPIIAERAVYWNDRTGGHCTIGDNSSASAYYFAEGCTANGFETWILLQNNGGDEANVCIAYLTPEGEIPGPCFRMEPYTRKSVNVADTVVSSDISTRVSSDYPVITERAVYWNSRTGGHCSLGAHRVD